MSKAVKITERIEGSWWEATDEGGTWHDWPAIGETATFPDSVADDLVTSGRAEYVKRAEEPPAETRPAPPAAETRVSEPKTGPPKTAKAARAPQSGAVK